MKTTVWLWYLSLLVTTVAHAQDESEKFRNQTLKSEFISKQDVKKEIVNYDISPILTKTDNRSVVGFIGKEFERIRIKFISVIRNDNQQDQYFVYGKSMVKENVCDFQGTLTITHAFYLKEETEPKFIKRGIVLGDYSFFENATQKHVGFFKGVFKINWYIDKQGQIQYDDLMLDADGFSNNEFVGSWTVYSGKAPRPCNWGDYRIPMSGDLDSGAGEFSPNKKYQTNGWASYVQALGTVNDTLAESARKKESLAWWR